MGWASGSSLFSDIISVFKVNIEDEETRYLLYKDLIPIFEDDDWDTQDECLGEDDAYDRALKELHTEWYNEDEEE